MINNGFKLAALISVAIGVTGCSSISSHLKEQESLTSVTPDPVNNIEKISKNLSEYKKKVSKIYYKYDFSSIEEEDLASLSKIKVKKFSVNETKLKDIMEMISDTYGVGVVFLVQSPQVLNRRITFRVKNTDLQKLLRQIEIIGNVDLYEKDGIVYLSDTLTVSTNLTRLEFPGEKRAFYDGLKKKVEIALLKQEQKKIPPVANALKEQISKLEAYLSLIDKEEKDASSQEDNSKDNGMKNQKGKQSKVMLPPPVMPSLPGGFAIADEPVVTDRTSERRKKPEQADDEFKVLLKQRIEKLKKRLVKNERLYYEEDIEIKPSVLIDSETGLFSIKGDPNLIRQSTEILSRIINSALSSATIKITFLSVNDTKAREFGINVSKVVQGLYSLSAGGATSAGKGIFDFQRSVTESNGDKLDIGIKALEKAGIIRNQTVNALTVFNGFSTELSKRKEVGNWIPGDISQTTNTTDGVATTSYSESKPTFEKDTVGRTLKITPRINLDEKRINLMVDFTDSSIYKEETFSWERSVGDKTFPTQIKKPLKTENKIKSAVILSEGEYAILTGLDENGVNMTRSGLPGTGKIPLFQDIGSNNSLGSSSKEIVIISAEFPKTQKVIKVKAKHM